jgi:hypothetical protein
MSMLTDFEKDIVISRLEGWELIELLNVSIEEVLDIALSEYWINQENVSDLREALGLPTNGSDTDE